MLLHWIERSLAPLPQPDAALPDEFPLPPVPR
jgi:hypothetical protein